jgi:endonuclease YncB( thermonuclease family)
LTGKSSQSSKSSRWKKWLLVAVVSIGITTGGVITGGQPDHFLPDFGYDTFGQNDDYGEYTYEGLPSDITDAGTEGISIFGYIYVDVIKITDGDTIVVNYKEHDYKVRLLDIDTPEYTSKYAADRNYAKKAATFTGENALGERVKLVFEERLMDPYGRLLAHVFLSGGEYLNGMLVEEGYARVEIIEPNSAAEEWFNEALKAAMAEKAGYWALPEDERPLYD